MHSLHRPVFLIMEQIGNFTLELSPNGFPLSTDSMVLAHFARLPKQARVLDLGSGCGTLGLLLCAKAEHCHVTGIELDEAAHAMALENIQKNGLASRMDSICGDIREIPRQLPPGSFDLCVSNPPYFAAGPASASHPTARREDCCNLSQLMEAAAWALRYGGDLCLVHRPERLAELCALASRNGLEPKRLCLVRRKPQDPVSLVLVQCRKGGKPGLHWEELCLYEADGSPSAAYKAIYHR